MDDKKNFSLSISKTNSDGTTSNISLNTPYADEVMALLKLSGVTPPPMSPVEVVADPHAMEPCGCEEEMATEEYANEPNAQTVDQQTPRDFGLKRNLQKKNDVGNYRGDNHLGESLMAKYQEFKKKKELNEHFTGSENIIKIGRAHV